MAAVDVATVDGLTADGARLKDEGHAKGTGWRRAVRDAAYVWLGWEYPAEKLEWI